MKILVIDDEAHIRKNLQEFLSYEGYDVDTASTIDEAHIKLENNCPDYTFIDLKLDTSSEYGGIKLFQFIKNHGISTHPLLLSAYPFDGDVKAEFRIEFQSNENVEELLNNVEENYISKGGELNFILAVIDKLNQLAKK
jgi:CheY-like chemotaxis protein